jgi:hypothetical protein
MALRNEGTVEIQQGGQTYKGEWKVERGLLTVRYALEHETTQVGNEPHPPLELARQLLSELVNKYLGNAR